MMERVYEIRNYFCLDKQMSNKNKITQILKPKIVRCLIFSSEIKNFEKSIIAGLI